MNCESVKQYLPEYWDSLLDPATRREVSEHLAACGECRADSARLKNLWFRLGAIPDEAPAPGARERFEDLLSDYRKHERPSRWNAWLANWWPRQPVVQMALSVACLAVGVLAGHSWTVDVQRSREVARLQTEVSTTRQLVALSLLRQQAATDRLQGIDWSSQIPRPEPQVVRALVETVNFDDTVDVRLAAVDALRRLASEPEVQSEMADSLTRQDSPLVQIALIDALADQRTPAVRDAITRLNTVRTLNPSVRSHAQSVLLKMQ